jgi:TolB-like protein/Flp pilus assembly protein TadD
MSTKSQYEFGRFRLDAGGRVLFCEEKRIQLTPKAVDVLLTLLENRGSPVSRHDLLLKVWADAVVEEGTLSSHISLLRKTLGAGYIETIPKRGYRFSGALLAPRDAQERHLLVVLPFENLSGTKKNDAFSDGLTEEMITQLGRMNPERLGVIARTSSMTYKSTAKTIQQIGRELGVSHALEGSVRRAGNQVRISAQLIQVSDQTHLWADNYEGRLEDILALQSNVAREVAAQIRIRLVPSHQSVKRLVPEAYEAFLQGRYLWNRRSERDLHASIRCFQTAIEKDPAYAPAYAGLADVYLTLTDNGYVSTREATAKARRWAQKALTLDENLAEAHVSVGHAAMHEFDWQNAKMELGRALDLNPNSFSARYYHSNFLVLNGAGDQAVREAEEARRLDPVSAAAIANISSILWHSGRYEESAARAKTALEIDRDYSRAYEDLGRAYEQLGRYDDAIAAFRKALGTPRIQASLAHTYALAGKRDETLKILRRLEKEAKRGFVSAFEFALIFLGLGRKEKLFASLDRAFDERSSALPFIKVNPRFAHLRRDRRFQKLLQRLGL